MNTINISRLEKTLSEILSDRHNKRIIVMLEGDDDNSDTVSNNSDPGKRSWFPDVRNVVRGE